MFKTKALHTPHAYQVLQTSMLVADMGSYGDRWIRCSWCEKWGKTLTDLPESVTPLISIDGIGELCEPCFDRCYPPHYDYLWTLLGPSLYDNLIITQGIANFAYPVCAEVAAWEERKRYRTAAIATESGTSATSALVTSGVHLLNIPYNRRKPS